MIPGKGKGFLFSPCCPGWVTHFCHVAYCVALCRLASLYLLLSVFVCRSGGARSLQSCRSKFKGIKTAYNGPRSTESGQTRCSR